MPANPGNVDVSAYVDLTLYDKDPTDLVESALLAAPTKVPDLDLPVLSTERAMVEVHSLLISELGFMVNRHPGATVEAIHAGIFRVPRDLGAEATTTVRFHLSDLLGHELPGGVRVRLTLGDGLGPVDYLTDLPVVAAAGAAFVDAAATAENVGATANGTPAGTIVDVITAVPYVETAELAAPILGGVDVEDDLTWFGRAQRRVDRLNDTLVNGRHFEAFAYEQPGITRALGLDEYNPDVAGVPGNAPGHGTVAVYGTGGPLDQAAKDALQLAMDAAAFGPLIVHVIDPTITAVTIAATLRYLPGFDPAVVEAAARDALADYLDAETWPWADEVYVNEVVTVLDAVEGVARVELGTVTIEGAAADFALPGVASLATFDDAGTVLTMVAA